MWESAESTTLWAQDGLALTRVRYHAERYDWSAPLTGDIDGVVLICYGAFRRRSDGVDHVVDPNIGYFRRVGEEVSVANFTGEPEEFSVIQLGTSLLGSLFAAPELPNGPFGVTSGIDLGHRMLLRSLASGMANDDVEEQVIRIVGSAVEQRRADVVRGSRRSTEPNWRCLVSDACEVLHDVDGDISVQELGRSVGCSPFHLSRVFRAITGSTISQYRLRLRVRAVLYHLDQGEEDLSALANAVGFADHSHMTRSVVAQLGETPSALRRRLRAGA
jgi:AraC-like DNA-binding protein